MVKTAIRINLKMMSGSRRDYREETRAIISELTALKHKLADLSRLPCNLRMKSGLLFWMKNMLPDPDSKMTNRLYRRSHSMDG